ncbi:MAG: T9SS type A sorting domain-containing protein [Saprospiraceae bacterium]
MRTTKSILIPPCKNYFLWMRSIYVIFTSMLWLIGMSSDLFSNTSPISIPKSSIGSPNGILYYHDWQEGHKLILCCYQDQGEKRFYNSIVPEGKLEVIINGSGIPDDAVWYYTPSSTTFQEKIWKVTALQDTIINNQTFKIIGIDKGQGIILESKIPIAITDEKMIFIEKGESHLLFDFSAKFGDTVTYKVPSLAYYYDVTFNEGFTKPELPTFQMIIENIDTVTSSEGKYLKRFVGRTLLENMEYEHGFFNIIQNVGTVSHGFFGSFGPYISIDKEGYFRCYQSGDLNYNTLNKDCLISNIVDSKDNQTINIFPNPSEDKFTIDYLLSELKISIYTIDGILVSKEKITPNAFVDISNYKSGIYIVEMRDFSGKMVSINKLFKL